MSRAVYRNIFPGKEPQDPEDHWQMGQYAFAVCFFFNRFYYFMAKYKCCVVVQLVQQDLK